jgi:hypothetical protein
VLDMPSTHDASRRKRGGLRPSLTRPSTVADLDQTVITLAERV